jgi:hypothetical protein
MALRVAVRTGLMDWPKRCRKTEPAFVMEATMGKRFVPVRDADKRAIELYLMLREVEQMPLAGRGFP